MPGNYNELSSLNSSEQPQENSPVSTLTSTSSGASDKKAFSWTSPSTWSTPSVSGMFKEETCEEKKDRSINAATKTIEKAKADYTVCASKRSAPKATASSGSMFSFMGFGSTPAAAPTAAAAAAAPKVGGRRKKTQKKQKKQRKQRKSKRRRTLEQKC
jgi:hypothetical protein